MPPKKGPKAYKMPPPLPKNEVLTDTMKKKWIIGPSIGKGGFGEIYAAAQGETPPKKESDYSYVIKIEPHENGPLFVEKNFYMRVGKPDDVLAWINSKKLKTFGMPVMHGSGSHDCGAIKYRFLVMDRYSKDLWSVFNSCNKSFPLSTTLQVAIQIVDVLEYIHSKGYVHADIKGANLLMGLRKGTENQVYVVDFGLASRFTTAEFKRDPKKAHNGTIEYTSRDAHAGVTTRRGDFEILAYNIVHWLSSKLPWEGNLKDPVVVEKAKESAMLKVDVFLKNCFGKKPIPDAVLKFVQYVSEMKYDDAPDYNKIRKILLNGLSAEGVEVGSALSFTKPLEQQNSISKAKKVRSSPRKTTKLAQHKDSTSETNGSEIENADSDQETEEVELVSKKRKTASSKVKPNPATKVSWKDCPTVKVSKVVRPGEYVSDNPKRKKKE